MSNDSINIKDKKLSTLRKILWLCFAGLSIPLVLSLVGLIVAFDVNSDFFTVPGPNSVPVSMLPFLIISPFLLLGVAGAVFLVIYYILKYRIEKDEELFL